MVKLRGPLACAQHHNNVTNLILHHLTLSPSIIEYVKTENQVADGLTKALDKRRIEVFRNTIRLELA